MPANAEIQIIQATGGFSVGVSWKLNDDPERPNKMSKTISITVSSEAAEDFASALGQNQQEAYQRVNAFLSQKLANFDPNHDVPKYESPPVEKWVITTNVLNG